MRIPSIIACVVLLSVSGSGASAGEGTNALAAVVHMQPAAVAPLLAKGGVTVLDLRTASEFSAKHIPGATNLNCQATDFSAQLAKLDRNQPYLIHCATGRRSTNALTEFQKLGFKHVIHLDGGLRAWEAGKNPVTKD